MLQKNTVYLDYAATTPVDPAVKEAMEPYLLEIFGNPMSVHSFGQEAVKSVDQSREKVASFLNCKANEIIFTSGATESNNLAIRGVFNVAKGKYKKPHIITSSIEHPCVINTCKNLSANQAEVTFIPINKGGLIRVDKIEQAIKNETVLVSIMYANNEIGTIQPIKEMGEMIKKINKERSGDHKIIFHTDAVQAVNYLECDVNKLKVDLLSLSGHKIYGPKGIGALYIKKDTPIKKIQFGGEQEYNLRAGTHNVPGIVGLGKAIELVGSKERIELIKGLRDKLIDGLLGSIEKSRLNGSREKRLPNNANLSFEGVEGEGIILSLDMEGIAVSTGSACSSGSLEPSHVLMALYRNPLLAHASVRFTLGKETKKEDIEVVLKTLPNIIKRLRKISPLYK